MYLTWLKSLVSLTNPSHPINVLLSFLRTQMLVKILVRSTLCHTYSSLCRINKAQWLKKIHTKKALSTGEVSTKYTCTAKRLKHFDYLGGLGAVEAWQDLCVQ